MFIHDIIKIKLSREGYLPDYPYHLISDEEMLDAFFPYKYDENDVLSGYSDFMAAKINYFRDNYPLIDESLEDKYKDLVTAIAWHIHEYKTDEEYTIPDWVYSYMLDATLGVNSSQLDLHDLFVLLGTDNLYDEFDVKCALACYKESQYWLNKLSPDKKVHRPPTVYGEPCIIKSLRLKASNLTEPEINDLANS